MTEILLKAEGLVAGYTAEVDILNGVDMEVRQGEIVTIVGPNGAGKSTLMKTIFGLLTPREGVVTLGGETITGLAPHSVTRKGVAYVAQLDNVFPSLTVRDNLELGAIAGGSGSVDERVERMYTLFPRLSERRTQPAGTMSGGERQMVAMARSLMPEPRLVLVDEPSAGLAPAFVDAIFEKLVEINESGVTILMVEQNAKRALTMSDRGYVLDLGKSRFTGPGKELIADPKVAELYLGGGAGRLDAADETPDSTVFVLRPRSLLLGHWGPRRPRCSRYPHAHDQRTHRGRRGLRAKKKPPALRPGALSGSQVSRRSATRRPSSRPVDQRRACRRRS